MTIKSRYAYKRKKLAYIIAILCMISVTSCKMQGVTSDLEEKNPAPQMVNITLEGGSGRAHILSPVEIIEKDGKSYAKLIWSSENYDYVIADGIKYENENPGGKSTFTVPVASFDEPFEFVGDTVAMSTPHEISYTLICKADSGDENEINEEPGGGQFGIRPEKTEDIIINGCKPTGKLELSEAEGFDVKEYGPYRLISIYGTGDYLLVPEGENVPDDIPVEVTPLIEPLERTYLASTSVMDFVRQIGALDDIRLSGLEEKDWHIDEARQYMSDGRIVYAGKYRAPDYELILSEGCDLAIENTMIFHDPEVKEKLEELGIPVLVETSSYEKTPLGRLEWIKLYGVLFGKEEEAEDFYRKESEKISGIVKDEEPKKTAAFFYVSATGMINVRIPGDYITSMIEAAGGKYIPEDARQKSGMGTMSMQMEDFYAQARSADILIYNSTIDGEIGSVSDLIEKNSLFADFKAVREHNVYCLTSDFFQKSTGMSGFVSDMHEIIEGNDGQTVFIRKLAE